MISLVSGTYNRLPLLKRMVESARKSAGDLALELVIVDGGSTDGTIPWCKSQTDIVLIEHGELLGAIKAYNDGCAAASGEYIVIGNDDVTFEGDTIRRAHRYLERNPDVGQAAFYHKYQRRGEKAKAGIIQGAMGYTYGQCCMTPRWLGDRAGWWGDEGMHTYGGDTRLGLRIWEMGYPVLPVEGCAVVDMEHQDGLRERNSDSPWKVARAGGEIHPDLRRWLNAWNHRMPEKSHWIPAATNRVIDKALAGTLRTMRFKGQMYPGAALRTGLIDALSAYGPTKQIPQTDKMHELGREKYQGYVLQVIRDFQPDLVLFQIQRENNITLKTIREIRQKFPWVYTVNWDGDTHYPLTEFHFEIAAAVHLQLVVSPTVFPEYAERGVGVGYWPIGIEPEYAQVKRPGLAGLNGHDVLFLGALYGEGHFPEAEFRRDAVLVLSKQSDIRFGLYGPGWARVGLETKSTSEKHGASAGMMARAKMTLSISQSAELWGYTSDRLYNICATGCPALVQRFAGMEHHGYVDGETCIAFSDFHEMIAKARHYLAHEEEREAIGRAGREMTLERHTWEARIPGLFAMIEGWGRE